MKGLSQSEIAQFQDGRTEFGSVESPAGGIGPVFNGTSCGECHRAGALGGASTNLTVSRVTRIGGWSNGYTDLTGVGGPVLQARSLAEFIPGYPIPPEVVPSEAVWVSHRITTPLFGLGLIEAIPDADIVDLAARHQPDGIHGEPNYVINPLNGNTEVGRFGWKAQVSNLEVFSADAYLNEMGITSPLFPHENLPQGQPIPPGLDPVADPEDDGTDVALFATFIRFLAPPEPSHWPSARGERLFKDMRCGSCHVPVQRTGRNPVRALSRRSVALYSDLLLHHMGPVLADGIQQGQAQGDQFKTAPLWGLRWRPFLLHDGRATNADAAIRAHGGEAKFAKERYVRLKMLDRIELLKFLWSL